MLEENRYLLTLVRIGLNFSALRRGIVLKSPVPMEIMACEFVKILSEFGSLSFWCLQKHRRRVRACAEEVTAFMCLLCRYKGRLLQNKISNELGGYLSLPWMIKSSCCSGQKKNPLTVISRTGICSQSLDFPSGKSRHAKLTFYIKKWNRIRIILKISTAKSAIHLIIISGLNILKVTKI